MIIREIESLLDAIGNRAALSEERNFPERAEALDRIEFAILDRIEGLIDPSHPSGALLECRRRAEGLRSRFEAIDEALFQRLRSRIREGEHKGAGFRTLVETYVPIPAGTGPHAEPVADRNRIGYDVLDAFINGLLHPLAAPEETREREPEMVFYQKTPARIVFDMMGSGGISGADVFFDLGSGLGQVPILINLLSGAEAKGVEFEPAYCDYANACAADLRLTRVETLQADARRADYSRGTVFFMYTPFEGRILQDVLERLREESRSRRIRVFTYGPCTGPVSRQGWLRLVDGNPDHPFQLGSFESL
ncbi:MAG: class SAM-dependent methyltransferase [Fibrobacteres bacterium]|nr:class SAM-dependent methyltransferase [Fibrobacterota bacterium]